MPEKKTKAQIVGLGVVEGFEVGVAESTERWTEISLEDGSVLRLKPVVMGALRVEGHYDPEGNPIYSLKVNPVMTVVSVPDHLRKPAGASGTQKPH